MNATTVPASRFGWDGQTVEYVVKAQGAKEVRVPDKCPGGLHMRILGTRVVNDGVEARVAVQVSNPLFY